MQTILYNIYQTTKIVRAMRRGMWRLCGVHKLNFPQMPNVGMTLKFEGWSKTQRRLIVIYGDFKAFQKHEHLSNGYVVKAAEFVTTELLKRFNITQHFITKHESKNR